MPTLVQFKAIPARAKIIPAPEIRAELDAYVRDFMADLIIKVSEYPPVPPPPNTYVRTGKLLSSWRLQPFSNPDEIAYRVTNAAQDRWGRYYVTYVHGPRQASFHSAHGWKNIADYRDQAAYRAGAQAIISRSR